jgi:hypothetical protein
MAGKFQEMCQHCRFYEHLSIQNEDAITVQSASFDTGILINVSSYNNSHWSEQQSH